MTKSYAVILLSLALAILLPRSASAASPSTEEYQVGPQDTLRLRVFEWRPGTGTAFEWTPLTGEFIVSSAGNLLLPIVGSIAADGKTTEQIADLIGERLQSQVGLQTKPFASVEVAAYRPFFISGGVAKPGLYSFTPGLTVLQALSMAGGIGPSDETTLSLQRDATTSEGDLRVLKQEQLGLLARQARIDAFIADANAIEFPSELLESKDDAGVERMMKEESEIFSARRRAMDSDLNALEQSKVLANSQIEALNAKAASLTKQTDLANKDLSSVNKLISQGLTVSSRELGANQTVAELESRSLDVSLAILKTQQDIAKFDQDTTSIRNRYHADALAEASIVRSELGANREKIKTAQEILANFELFKPTLLQTPDPSGAATLMLTLDRREGDQMRTIVVSNDDLVEPGDVLRVQPTRTSSLGRDDKDIATSTR